MSDIDEKLKVLLWPMVTNGFDVPMLIDEIKQAFTDAGYISPENAQKVQEMVNQITNLANDAFQIPTIQYVKPNKAMTKTQNLMSGQEFYDRFEVQFGQVIRDAADSGEEVMDIDMAIDAAKRAAGLSEGEV
jgi:hypothetical protein